ncbi:arsenate reductase ArsC [SAR202 cluster bacterium AC-647-N09_OGT_505m]|nr:arsenate reductase ArsC [SAR202 cluster bacterium AC-647-N09_OGT_505m]
MKNILFVCVHNSGRSQMAEAFFNHFANGRASALSAGTQPSDYVNPTVIQAMAELNMDISTNQPQILTQNMLDAAERVITMGCNVEEACPANMVVTEDWALEDPNRKPLERVREIRNAVRLRVEKLIGQLVLFPEDK